MLEPSSSSSTGEAYRGRMGLHVQGAPSSSWSAGFHLTGSANTGELRLISPIGTTLAIARWEPQSASIERGQTVQRYSDANAMVRDLLGADFQMPQLWAWLERKPLSVPGWNFTNTLRQDQGHLLIAQRVQAEPAMTLRVILSP